MMKTSLESAERMQQQQLEGIRNAMEENVRSTRQLSDVNTLGELMALQTRFAGAQIERTVDYWTRLWCTMGERVREGYAITARGAEDAGRFASSQAANVATTHERKERKSA